MRNEIKSDVSGSYRWLTVLEFLYPPSSLFSRTHSPWRCHFCQGRLCTYRPKARPCCDVSPSVSREQCSLSFWLRKTSAPSTATQHPAACQTGPLASAQVSQYQLILEEEIQKCSLKSGGHSGFSPDRLCSPQPLLSTAPRRSPCSAGSGPTELREARCATTRFALLPTSSPSETRTLQSHSRAACSSQRGFTLDTKVFLNMILLFTRTQQRMNVCNSAFVTLSLTVWLVYATMSRRL